MMMGAFSRDPTALFGEIGERCGAGEEEARGDARRQQPVSYRNVVLRGRMGPFGANERVYAAQVDWHTGTAALFGSRQDVMNNVPSFRSLGGLPAAVPAHADVYVAETFAFLLRGHSLLDPQCRCGLTPFSGAARALELGLFFCVLPSPPPPPASKPKKRRRQACNSSGSSSSEEEEEDAAGGGDDDDQDDNNNDDNDNNKEDNNDKKKEQQTKSNKKKKKNGILAVMMKRRLLMKQKQQQQQKKNRQTKKKPPPHNNNSSSSISSTTRRGGCCCELGASRTARSVQEIARELGVHDLRTTRVCVGHGERAYTWPLLRVLIHLAQLAPEYAADGRTVAFLSAAACCVPRRIETIADIEQAAAILRPRPYLFVPSEHDAVARRILWEQIGRAASARRVRILQSDTVGAWAIFWNGFALHLEPDWSPAAPPTTTMTTMMIAANNHHNNIIIDNNHTPNDTVRCRMQAAWDQSAPNPLLVRR